MVILFDPDIGFSLMDHNMDYEEARIRMKKYRDEKLPAFLITQEVEHPAQVDDAHDCLACHNRLNEVVSKSRKELRARKDAEAADAAAEKVTE